MKLIFKSNRTRPLFTLKSAFIAAMIGAVVIATQCFAETFSGEVVSVVDGDTIWVDHNGKREEIRLNGIDSPERTQPFGGAATSFTLKQCLHVRVSVIPVEVDRFRRTVADVELPNGKLLNNELVRAGLAWWYVHYAPNNTILRQLEQKARQQHIGLWADANPIAPWDFRHKTFDTAPIVTTPAKKFQGEVKESASQKLLQGRVDDAQKRLLEGRVDDAQKHPLEGRADREQVPNADLYGRAPNPAAVMHIVQFRLEKELPPRCRHSTAASEPNVNILQGYCSSTIS